MGWKEGSERSARWSGDWRTVLGLGWAAEKRGEDVRAAKAQRDLRSNRGCGMLLMARSANHGDQCQIKVPVLAS